MSLLRMVMFIFVLVSSVGCAVAPFTTPKSGQTIGKGNWQLDTPITPAPGVAASYGATEDFDLSVLYEQQFGAVLSAIGKYSVANNKSGLAAALYGGVFTGSGLGSSNGWFAGPVVSYKTKGFEPYLSVRYSFVSWEFVDLTSDEINDDTVWEINVADDDVSFSYIQTDFGFNFWFNKNVALNLHGKVWSVVGDDVTLNTAGVIPGLGFIFNL